MGLMDDIRGETRVTGIPCGVKAALDRLTGQDRADLVTALADPQIPATNIARALTKRGVVNMKDGDPVTRHRRGDCRCDRP